MEATRTVVEKAVLRLVYKRTSSGWTTGSATWNAGGGEDDVGDDLEPAGSETWSAGGGEDNVEDDLEPAGFRMWSAGGGEGDVEDDLEPAGAEIAACAGWGAGVA